MLFRPHPEVCLRRGGLHMSNISFGQEAEKQRIYASVGCSQAQAVDWKGSSEEPGFVCLPKCCGNLAMCFWLRNVLIKIFVLLFILCLILRIIFFTTIRYKSLWSTANKLLNFGHISWFQFSTLKKQAPPPNPKQQGDLIRYWLYSCFVSRLWVTRGSSTLANCCLITCTLMDSSYRCVW